MKVFLFVSLLSLAACGGKPSSFNYGKATVADLVAEKGEPIEKKPIPVKDGQMFVYSSDEKYQVQNDVVTHGLKNPKGDEKTLLYWKHRFKDCETQNIEISKANGHAKSEYELKCAALGLTIVYTDGSEFISRVIEHEKK